MNRHVQSQSYAYFLVESQDLLQTIEQGLFRLRTNRSPQTVHELMRAAHTLKGAAASVELDAISNVAHILEDIFRAFHNPNLTIDADVEGLLFEGYECLRLLVNAHQTGTHVDEADLKNRAAGIIMRLQTQLGDRFDRAVAIPTSSELGFDIVQSIFEMGVEQRLETLRGAVQTQSPELATILRSTAEIFLGLGESLNLPGFAEIAQTTLNSLTRSPDRSSEIAQIALTNFTQAQKQVLAGDRTHGGAPVESLKTFVPQTATSVSPMFNGLDEIPSVTERTDSTGNSDPFSLLWQATPSPVSVPGAEPLTRSLVDPSAQKFGIGKLLQTEVHPDRWWRSLTAWVQTLASHDAASIPASSPEPLTTPEPTLEELFGMPSDTGTMFDNASAISITDAPDESTLNAWPTDIDPAIPDFFPDPIVSETPSVPETPSAGMTEGLDQVPASEVEAPAKEAEVIAQDRVEIRPTTIRVDLHQLDKLNYLTSELLLSQNQQTSQQTNVRLLAQELLDQLQKHRRTLNTLTLQADRLSQPQRQVTNSLFNASLQQQFDVLELDRYSDVQVLAQSALNEMAELGAIAEAIEQTYRGSSGALESQQRLMLNLNADLTTIRMQPLDSLFQRIAQVLQQLSSSHHKPIRVVLKGSEVLVDKAVIDKLYDPLLHLVRNAFDHGIESPDVRRANGKPETGCIEIIAFHQGNSTVIDVKDDGAGIDRQRVVQQAIASGLLEPSAVDTYTEAEVLSLLFQPGFSTAAQISELSGRGVGLDVVKTELATLKARVTVRSVPQQGTVFSLHLPFTLTIAKLLICQANGILYALPLEDVKQVIIPHPDQLSVGAQHTLLHWHQDGEETPIVVRSLSALLGYQEPMRDARAIAPQPTKASGAILLLQLATGLVAIQVDQVEGEEELVIRPFSPTLSPPPYVYGCSLMRNNQMALVLDIKTLLSRSLTVLGSEPSLSSRLPSTQKVHNTRILLIEDSLTVRQTLASMLQQVDYDVAQAQDGLDALMYLQQQPQVDLIICDLEMPRMNGFEFLSQRRQQQVLNNIPVIILTSRSTSKYRQLAQELGANEFINKPYNDRALLSVIDHLIADSSIAKEVSR